MQIYGKLSTHRYFAVKIIDIITIESEKFECAKKIECLLILTFGAHNCCPCALLHLQQKLKPIKFKCYDYLNSINGVVGNFYY